MCSDRVDQLDEVYKAFVHRGIENIKIIAIGKNTYPQNTYNNNWTDGNIIPVVLNNDIWDSRGAYQRDLFFLDSSGVYQTHYNITEWDKGKIEETIHSLLPSSNN